MNDGEGRRGRKLRRLALGAAIWMALAITALVVSGGWPRTFAAWCIALAIGPLVVVTTDVLAEVVASSKVTSARARSVRFLLLVTSLAAAAAWANTSDAFAAWWRINFGA